MKKKSALITMTLAFSTLLCVLIVNPARADISSYRWIGTYEGYDAYWNQYSMTVFPEGTEATLVVTVYNTHWPPAPLNVSTVKVWLDWNANYSSTEVSEDNPISMNYQTYRSFTVRFTLPDVTTVSNLVMHHFTIYVEAVNATTGPKQASTEYMLYGYGFTVYSTTQNDAQKLYNQLYNMMQHMPNFHSQDAQMAWFNGTLEYQTGLQSYESGSFTDAHTHYQNSLNLFYQALSTETGYDNYWESNERQGAEADVAYRQAQAAQLQANALFTQAQADYYEAMANATLKQADASMIEANARTAEANATMREADAQFATADAFRMQSYAWILFGLGFIVFGFAAVVWAFRRAPKPPQTDS
jgi:FlaG/FlaF family flagellin (archaellin)